MPDNQSKLFRQLPSVDVLLTLEEIATLTTQWQRELVVLTIHDELERLRRSIREGYLDEQSLPGEIENIAPRIQQVLEQLTAASFRRVVNATGIIVHTNLGRSPLMQSSLDSIRELAGRYLNLEFDLDRGKRGQRDAGVRRLLRSMFPGFDGIVVNNNAAALLLALNTLAEGHEVIISRGRIIEIGDGFRINQIQEKSGARLVEVGTTNRTHLKDFEEAIGKDTALLLSVHPSNYRVVGFTADVELRELVTLGRKRYVPVVEDWGSGCIVDPDDYGIPNEEAAKEVLASGPDAICFSGDKLLGGPQAGIIVGKPKIIESMRKNHLYRALRVCKLTLIAMEETLRVYLSDREDEIPTVEMLGRSATEMKQRAKKVAMELNDLAVRVVDSSARVGGGAAPEIEIPSIALEITPADGKSESMKDRLRLNDPPVIARVKDERIYLDMRTVFPDEDEIIVSALRKILAE